MLSRSVQAGNRISISILPRASPGVGVIRTVATTTSVVPDAVQRWIDAHVGQRILSKQDYLHDKQMELDALTFNLDASTASTRNSLPPCRHWMYFLPQHGGMTSTLNADGHDAGKTPPSPFVTRMWAGGHIEWTKHVARLNTDARLEVDMVSAKFKNGRSGPLLFVRQKNTIYNDSNDVCVIDHQDFVYRPHTARKSDPAPQPIDDVIVMRTALNPRQHVPADALWRHDISASEIVLFRYSALTFNSHRIHYDIDYCTKQEGFPGVVVHGPLLCTAICDAVEREEQASIRSIDYRAISPLYVNEVACLYARPTQTSEGEKGREVTIVNGQGTVVMQGIVSLH